MWSCNNWQSVLLFVLCSVPMVIHVRKNISDWTFLFQSIAQFMWIEVIVSGIACGAETYTHLFLLRIQSIIYWWKYKKIPFNEAYISFNRLLSLVCILTLFSQRKRFNISYLFFLLLQDLVSFSSTDQWHQ